MFFKQLYLNDWLIHLIKSIIIKRKLKMKNLGDRMKNYEKAYSYSLLPNAMFVVRLDGRGFSKYTKKMKFKKPFDNDLIQIMQNVTADLMKQTQASFGYTQSDEISLVYMPERMMFNGRIEKICSVFASLASVSFNLNLAKQYEKQNNQEKIEKSNSLMPIFDCRVFSVPSKEEALNAVLWREYDAVKNSINVLAQSLFSFKELQNLNGKQLQYKMLTEKDVNWNDLPLEQKRGTYLVRKVKEIVPNENSPECKNIPKEVLDKLIQNNETIKRGYIEINNDFVSMNSLTTEEKDKIFFNN